MKKPIICLLLIVAAMIYTAAPALAGGGLATAEIEVILMNHEEQGYSFSESLDYGMWLVEYQRPDWKLSWEVAVTTTDPDPEKSLVVIGTTLASTESLSGNLLLQMLHENSLDSNPGAYSVYIGEDGIYYLQYSLKLPQTLVNENVLVEIIGFVAGYANSRMAAISKYLAPTPAPEPAEEESEPAEEAE